MKKIVFLSGTRADFGKLKSLIQIIEEHSEFESFIFATGMHQLEKYGKTVIEIEKSNFSNIYSFSNHTSENTMDLTLAKTIEGFSSYIKQCNPDLIVIHGDRLEALAGAIVGALNNVLVAHIEGGEVSGTIDELIRHSVSKMSHLHYVANDLAKKRLLQLGEIESSIKVIGSPDVDIMFSKGLPSLNEVKKYYEIPFENYAIVLFHPVTTEVDQMAMFATEFVNALLEDDNNYVVIYPNNDLGSAAIFKSYQLLENNPRFRIFPSIRFESFLTLLKNSKFIIGNSSAGIREAPYYGVPTINLGNRQESRAVHPQIINAKCVKKDILNAIRADVSILEKDLKSFGLGNSANLFLASLLNNETWLVSKQKKFQDIKT